MVPLFCLNQCLSCQWCYIETRESLPCLGSDTSTHECFWQGPFVNIPVQYTWCHPSCTPLLMLCSCLEWSSDPASDVQWPCLQRWKGHICFWTPFVPCISLTSFIICYKALHCFHFWSSDETIIRSLWSLSCIPNWMAPPNFKQSESPKGVMFRLPWVLLNFCHWKCFCPEWASPE